jgi:hypothetical protein
MAAATATRAREWAADVLDAEDVGTGASYHIRDGTGRRIRVAGRHIRARQPNFFALGATLDGNPFDDLVVVLFNTDWSIRYAYRLPLHAAIAHHRQPGQQGCRLMIVGDDDWRSDPAVERLDSDAGL